MAEAFRLVLFDPSGDEVYNLRIQGAQDTLDLESTIDERIEEVIQDGNENWDAENDWETRSCPECGYDDCESEECVRFREDKFREDKEAEALILKGLGSVTSALKNATQPELTDAHCACGVALPPSIIDRRVNPKTLDYCCESCYAAAATPAKT